MPFIIVETTEENDTKLLLIVPNSWVSNNVYFGYNHLRWPLTKSTLLLDKLQRDSHSLPDNNWTYQNCKIIRVGFSTFESALTELQKMECKSDAEDEKCNLEAPLNGDVQQSDKSSPAAVARKEEQMTRTDNMPQQQAPVIQTQSVSTNNQQSPQRISEGNNQDAEQLIDSSVNITCRYQMAKIFSTLNTLLENQTKLMENQNDILKQLSKQQSILNSMVTICPNKKILISSYLDEPFSKMEDLEELEIKLGNIENFQNFVCMYQNIFSFDGKDDGKDACYKLLETIFEPELLSTFVWSGNGKNVGKRPFKKYDNIMNAFSRIIKTVDSSFNYDRCISFFQKVIRNSAKRKIENDFKNKKTTSYKLSGHKRTHCNSSLKKKIKTYENKAPKKRKEIEDPIKIINEPVVEDISDEDIKLILEIT